jgi:hypothetical protein
VIRLRLGHVATVRVAGRRPRYSAAAS